MRFRYTDTFIDSIIIEPWQNVPTGVTTDIIAPTQIAVSSGSCTLTFEAQTIDVVVGIRVF